MSLLATKIMTKYRHHEPLSREKEKQTNKQTNKKQTGRNVHAGRVTITVVKYIVQYISITLERI